MVNARELEFVLYDHPAVWDVAIIDKSQDHLAVFVQPRAGQKVDSEELAQFCRERLGDDKVPEDFYVINKLPKTKTGKISRQDLLALITPVPSPLKVFNL
ncbi:MAG: hypothetical protein M0Z55_13660 [Peptococcaceae bacterium]|nr:hypothetical protein [Peptococcaceae bacterium]